MLTLFMFPWTGICLMMLGFHTVGLATTPSMIDELGWVWLVLVVVAYFAINYLVWQLRGAEVLIISNGMLSLHNTGTFVRRRLTLAIEEVEDITWDEDLSTPYSIKHWGVGGGKVLIHHHGRVRRYGQDLSVGEAKRVAALVRMRLDAARPSTG